MSNLINQIDDLIEYKKLIIKLEEALKQKELENAKINKLNIDLKQLCEDMKNQLNQQSTKIISLYSEIKNIKKNYDQKIDNLINEHEKENQKYDEKILELSSYNPKSLTSKITKELETKYENEIKNKDLKIDNLQNEIKELKKNLSLNQTELNLLKQNFEQQLNTEKEIHLFQMNDLIQKINNQEQLLKSDEDKNTFDELKLAIKYNDSKNEVLYKELENVRTEKNENEILANKKIFELETQLKEEKLNNKIINEEFENIRNDFKNVKKYVLENIISPK